MQSVTQPYEYRTRLRWCGVSCIPFLTVMVIIDGLSTRLRHIHSPHTCIVCLQGEEAFYSLYLHLYTGGASVRSRESDQ